MCEQCKCPSKKEEPNLINIDYYSFREIKLSYKDIFNKLISEKKNIISGYNFVNLFLWSESHKAKLINLKDKICIYYGDEDAFFFPLSVEDMTIDEVIELSNVMIEKGHSGNFIYVDYDYVLKNEDIINYFDIEIDEDNSDYIYSIDDLCNLSGKKLKKKKNLVSQFLRNNPDYEVRNLQKECFNDCLALADNWSHFKNIEDSSNLSADITQLRKALEYYDELELEGICIRSGDAMVGFSIFNPQNEETVICHFEKYNSEIKGAGQIINWETAKYLKAKGYLYLNREQDLGIEGLRKAKESYDPIYKKKVCKLIRHR